MKKLIPILLFTCITFFASAQTPTEEVKHPAKNPIFFLDSVKVDKEDLKTYNPNLIAYLTIYKDKEAIDLFGEQGKDGVVFIITIPYAKRNYWHYFSSKSSEYLKSVPSAAQDSTVQYILNGRVLKKNFEGNLALIDDKVFKEIKIISKEALMNDYQITDKEIGVVITSDPPKNLHNSKDKF